MCRAVVVAGLAGVVFDVARAQPRPAPPVATVVRVQQVDGGRARRALVAHLPGIARCLADARLRDPGPLADVRTIDATLVLDRRGAAVSVEFVPPLLSRGLSACLAERLLDWSQGEPVGLGAQVVLRIRNGVGSPRGSTVVRGALQEARPRHH